MKIVTFLCVVILTAGTVIADVKRPALDGSYVATAYDLKGITASGDYVHRHVVAADPDVLPLGTRIKIRRAGKYSGEYVVADTGQKIQGRRLDIFLPGGLDCKKFGRKRVKVLVMELGDGTHQTTTAANLKVKEDVKNELDAKAVGGAATEQDWTVKKEIEKKGVTPEQASEVASKVATPPAVPKIPASPASDSTTTAAREQ